MNEEPKNEIRSAVRWLLATYAAVAAAVGVFLLMCLLCGCTRTVYEPMETVRTEYVGMDNTELLKVIKSLTDRITQKDRQIDSLMQSNRELLVLSDKGDTLRHDRETIIYRASHHEKELERIVEAQHDSIIKLQRQLLSIKADSIPVPYPVERELTRWEQTKQDYGGDAIVTLAVIVIAAVAWLIKKFRK